MIAEGNIILFYFIVLPLSHMNFGTCEEFVNIKSIQKDLIGFLASCQLFKFLTESLHFVSSVSTLTPPRTISYFVECLPKNLFRFVK